MAALMVQANDAPQL